MNQPTSLIFRSTHGRRFLIAVVVTFGLVAAGCAAEGDTGGSTSAVRSTPAQLVDAGGTHVTMYQNPSCGCCGKWTSHMTANGFDVEIIKISSIGDIKEEHGLNAAIASCHTALVDGYVVEGHVPADLVLKMLEERPEVVGITAPGMPAGSPGMESDHPESYHVLTFDAEGNTKLFAAR